MNNKRKMKKKKKKKKVPYGKSPTEDLPTGTHPSAWI
jgi:hypothetical protein